MIESTITSKGQTTLPKAVREALGVGPGDRVRYRIEGDAVRIVRPRSVLDLVGCLKEYAGGRPLTIDEMDEAVAEGAAASGMAGLEPEDPVA